MNNDPVLNRFRELRWRRKLSAQEETELRAYLARHPELKPEWQLEAALGEALDRLPAVPVSSNFTMRVVEAAERDAATHMRRYRFNLSWFDLRRWLPRAAFAVVAAGAGIFSYHAVQAAWRAELAQSVAAVSEVAALPSPEVLKDFDAIRILNRTPPADEQLLTLLQ